MTKIFVSFVIRQKRRGCLFYKNLVCYFSIMYTVAEVGLFLLFGALHKNILSQ